MFAMRSICLVAISFGAFLVGCDQHSIIQKFTPPEDESYARNLVDLLRQGEFDEVKIDLDPALIDAKLQERLGEMAASFPDGDPVSVKVVGLNVSKRDQDSITTIQLEYEFPNNKWVLATVEMQKKDDITTVEGFHVGVIPESLETRYSFGLGGKTRLQYAVLILAIGSVLFSFYVFIVCIRTKMDKRKWLWLLFVLVGVGRLAVNWATGVWSFTVLAAQIPSGIANHPPYGAWTVAAYLPLGAILFLQHRWMMRVKGELIDPPLQAPS